MPLYMSETQYGQKLLFDCIYCIYMYIYHTEIHRKLQNVVYMKKKIDVKKKDGGGAIRGIIGSYPQVPVRPKGLSSDICQRSFYYNQ